jgi:hypothetical protein
LTGHPHEFGELSEEVGVLTRINATDLSQRNAAAMPNAHAGNQRLAFMALGRNADGGGVVVEQHALKKRIFLNSLPDGGVNKDSVVIKGMRARYDAMRKNLGLLNPLSDEEAADLYVTDVLAPYFLKNSKDWLMFLSMAHGVRGASSGKVPANVSNKQAIARTAEGSEQTEPWDDFELYMVCRNENNGKFENRKFESYKQLWDYLYSRYTAGQIDQKIDIPKVEEVEKSKLDQKKAAALENIIKLAYADLSDPDYIKKFLTNYKREELGNKEYLELGK